MNELDDLLSLALHERASGAPGAGTDLLDVHRRSRRHRAVRRGVVGACAGILTVGMVAVVATRSPNTAPSAAEAVDDGSEPGAGLPASECAAGQILSAEGDIVIHEGVPLDLTAGQCLSVGDVTSSQIFRADGECFVHVETGGAPTATTIEVPVIASVTTSIVEGAPPDLGGPAPTPGCASLPLVECAGPPMTMIVGSSAIEPSTGSGTESVLPPVVVEGSVPGMVGSIVVDRSGVPFGCGEVCTLAEAGAETGAETGPTQGGVTCVSSGGGSMSVDTTVQGPVDPAVITTSNG